MPKWKCVSTFSCAGLLIGLWSAIAIAAPLPRQQPSDRDPRVLRVVDFRTEVLPILDRHCFQCHAGEKREGDLRLDRLSEVQRGGHTGNSILGDSLENSELYLRISSDSEGYRMPKTNAPLSEAEIETLGQWILGGAVWPTPAGLLPKEEPPDSLTQRLADGWLLAQDAWKKPSWRQGSMALGIGILMWIGWTLLSRIQTGASDASATGTNRSRGKAFLAWVTGLALIVGIAFLIGRLSELTSENSELQAELVRLKPEVQATPVIDRDHLILPPYPMHPRRLGGTYYRGNDERNAALFNGGFYRTATIELHLVDPSGVRLAWTDVVSETPAVELTIHRAPNATLELFSKRVLESVYLKQFSQSQPSSEPIQVLLDELEPDQSWRALFPISELAKGGTGQATGMIYLFYGAQTNDGQIGVPHFGIRYDVRLVDGRIDTESELWMGSTYNLNGRVLVPGEGQVLLDRWFDFRPIPEIEGQPSDDPELLGLPEHLRRPAANPQESGDQGPG